MRQSWVPLLVIALLVPLPAMGAKESAQVGAGPIDHERVPLGVLFRSDIPGLLKVADFLYEDSTPAAAIATFSPGVATTLEQWWIDPMDARVSKAETRAANEAISSYVRANNAAIFREQLRAFASFLAVVDPGARITPLYQEIQNPLGFVTIQEVDTRSIHHIRQHPLVAETKALVTPLTLHLSNAYVSSRASELASYGSIVGDGIVIGILDTGIQPTSALQFAGSIDVSTGSAVEPSPGACTEPRMPGISHGTLVAESAASRHSVLRAPASGARVFDIKIWPTANDGTSEDLNFEQTLIDGYAVAVSNALPLVVISSGLTPSSSESDGGGDILSRIVNRNARLGVPTYIAAGNGGTSQARWITAPAGAWDGLTVGAAHTGNSGDPRNARRADYTSFGASPGGATSRSMGGPTKPEVMYFGSTNPSEGLFLPWPGRPSVSVSGTSFAAPFAAGIGAQPMEQRPAPAPYHSLLHRGLISVGTSSHGLDGTNIWRISSCESCQMGLVESPLNGYGLIDAVHASQGHPLLGSTIPRQFSVGIPANLRDGSTHRLNMILVTHADDTGIDGLDVWLDFTCRLPDGSREGGGGSVYGGNGAHAGFLLRPHHDDCKLRVTREDGATSNTPFVVVLNSEVGWS